MANRPPFPYDLARAQAGTLSSAQLREAGIERRRVQRRVDAGELVVVNRGLYRMSGAPTTWHQRIWAALLEAPPDTVVSHRTAARLHGIGTFTSAAIDLARIRDPANRTAVAPTDLHRTLHLPGHHLATVDGIPTTSVARTVFDLAALVSPKRWARDLPSLPRRQVERALDDALARGLPISAVEQVLREHGGRGRGGTRVLRSLLEERGEGYVATESVLEDLVLQVLREHKLPTPVRQQVVHGEHGWIGRIDFAFPPYRTLLEADGRQHHTMLLDQERDRWRDLALAAEGSLVVRVTWRQLVDAPGRFATDLGRVLRARGWDGSPASAA